MHPHATLRMHPPSRSRHPHSPHMHAGAGNPPHAPAGIPRSRHHAVGIMDASIIDAGIMAVGIMTIGITAAARRCRHPPPNAPRRRQLAACTPPEASSPQHAAADIRRRGPKPFRLGAAPAGLDRLDQPRSATLGERIGSPALRPVAGSRARPVGWEMPATQGAPGRRGAARACAPGPASAAMTWRGHTRPDKPPAAASAAWR